MPSNKSVGTDLHDSAIIYPNVTIGEDVSVGEYSIVGKPYRPIDSGSPFTKRPTKISQRCHLGSLVIVGAGSRISEGCLIDNGVKIEQDVRIGKKTRVIYQSQICNYAQIGKECIIGGFVCENAKIEERVRMFGMMIHSQKDPTSDWDGTAEPAPVIKRGSFVGFGALIIGGIKIGPKSLVCAGATITKNVPPRHIASGVNEIVAAKHWHGSLRNAEMFKGL